MPAERRGRGGLFSRVNLTSVPSRQGLAWLCRGRKRGACPSLADRCRALCRALIAGFKNDGMVELLGDNFW